MAAAFHLRVLSADDPFYEGEAVSLILPGVDGRFGIMAHHSNLVASVVPGTLLCRLPDGSALTAVVSHGLVRVEDNDVLVLVGSLERPEEIDLNRAQRAADRARENLLHAKTRQERLQAQSSLERALGRLEAVRKRS